MIELSDLVDLLDQDIFEGDGEGIYLPLEIAERVVEELRNKDNVLIFYKEKQDLLNKKEELIVKPLHARITSLEQKAAIDKKQYDNDMNTARKTLNDAVAKLGELQKIIDRYSNVYGDVPPAVTELGTAKKPVANIAMKEVLEDFSRRIQIQFTDGYVENIDFTHAVDPRVVLEDLFKKYGTQLYKFRGFMTQIEMLYKPKAKSTKDIYDELFKDFTTYDRS